MTELFMQAKNLAGNKNTIQKGDIEILKYNRPYIKGSVSESSGLSDSLKFGNPIIGKFSVVTTIGNHVQGAIDWLTKAEVIETVEIRKDHMVNGKRTISAKDIYCNVRIESLTILYSDETDIAIVIYMTMYAQNFQLADVGFKDTTEVTATSKVGILNHSRKVQK